MVEIQKYSARITKSDIEVIGYITECREYLENGCYGTGIDYVINVTEKSMPENEIRGSFLVDKNTIEKFIPCAVCKIKQSKENYNYCVCSQECYKEL